MSFTPDGIGNLPLASGGTLNVVWNPDSNAATPSFTSLAEAETYFTNNPGELDPFLSNGQLLLQVNDPVEVEFYNYVNGSWLQVFPTLIITAGEGLSPSGLTGDDVPMFDGTSNLIPSGLKYDATTDRIVSEKTLEVEKLSSIQYTAALSMGAQSAQLIVQSLATGKYYQIPYHEFDLTTGSIGKPFTEEFAGFAYKNLSLIDTSIVDPGTISYTVSTPGADGEIIKDIVFKTDGDIIEARLKVTATATGKDIYYFPSKSQYEAGRGVDFSGAGEQVIHLDSEGLRVLDGDTFDITIDYIPNGGNVLGSALGVPYLKLNVANFTFVNLAYDADRIQNSDDIAEIQQNYVTVTTFSSADNVTENIVLGIAEVARYKVNYWLSVGTHYETGEMTIVSDGTGISFDNPITAKDDVPYQQIDYNAAIDTGNIVIQLIGSGAGTGYTFKYIVNKMGVI
jgi:hypothetical protein